MKKITLAEILTIIISVVIFLSFTTIPANADRRGKEKRQRQGMYQKHERRPPERGYRYRYYGHRRHHHPKHYRGHWKSWNQWESHRRHNRRPYRDGRYYREGGRLYFEFENEDGRFVFSIGR